MPNYYNPYNFFPATYQTQYTTQQQGPKMMEWVEGEVGAKAYQMPQGWPANSPIPLWDSTDTVIWLKSWGPMGIPNPMQKLHYDMPEQNNQMMIANGSVSPSAELESNYVTKQEFEELRKELQSLINQNGSNSSVNNVNRGGNR